MDEEESAHSLPNDSSAAEPEDIIATTVLEHDNKLNYLHEQLAEQQKTLTGILKLLKAQTRSLSGQAPSPWNLKDGTGEQQRQILRQLQDWIDWYNQTYPGWRNTSSRRVGSVILQWSRNCWRCLWRGRPLTAGWWIPMMPRRIGTRGSCIPRLHGSVWIRRPGGATASVPTGNLTVWRWRTRMPRRSGHGFRV